MARSANASLGLVPAVKLGQRTPSFPEGEPPGGGRSRTRARVAGVEHQDHTAFRSAFDKQLLEIQY